tara:strand:- start:190 stop:774 length:585 start_codon:yes stop_codon:yes gene_type:complete
MRLKNSVIIDINEKVGWLHLTGGAVHSMMAWLNEFHLNEFKEVPKDDLQNYGKDVFAILAEPEKRYWNGITEWSTCWGDYEWWQHDDIMEWFPHFDRYTWRYSDQIDGVKEVKHFIKLDNDLSDKIEALAKQYDFKCPYGIEKVRPRYKKDKTVIKLHETITPKFKKLVEESPELKQKLEDYLAPDVWYYHKAQ